MGNPILVDVGSWYLHVVVGVVGCGGELMAGCDYYSCDVCGGKTFYDANIVSVFEFEKKEVEESGWVCYPGCGGMKAICPDCAKTHKVVVVEK